MRLASSRMHDFTVHHETEQGRNKSVKCRRTKKRPKREEKTVRLFVTHGISHRRVAFCSEMVGKDIRKLSQQNRRGRGKGAKPHKARAKYKACDPFSGRSYNMDEGKEFNDDPDASELEDYVDNETDDISTYTDFKKKPSYRRDRTPLLTTRDA